MIAVSIYCYPIKYQPKQKHLLLFNVRYNKCIINLDIYDESRAINIKNRVCYYFHGVIKIKDFVINNILIDEKPKL